MHAGQHVLSHHHPCRHAFSRHGGRHAARWPGTRRKWCHLRPIKCGDAFWIRLKVTLGITLGKGRFGKKYGIFLTHTLYLLFSWGCRISLFSCCLESGAGTDLSIDFHEYCLATFFKWPSVTRIWCRNVSSFRWWAWKVKYLLSSLIILPFKFIAELMDHSVPIYVCTYHQCGRADQLCQALADDRMFYAAHPLHSIHTKDHLGRQRAGHTVRSGQVRSGQVRTGQVRSCSGQVRSCSGQAVTGPERHGRAGRRWLRQWQTRGLDHSGYLARRPWCTDWRILERQTLFTHINRAVKRLLARCYRDWHLPSIALISEPMTEGSTKSLW